MRPGVVDLLPTTLIQCTDEPLVRGVTLSGRDITCPSCGSLLLANIAHGEVFDVVVWCRCRRRVTLPALPPGRGLGGVVVELPPGVVTQWTPFVNDCEAVLCGAAGSARRSSETSASLETPERGTLDTQGLRHVVEAARLLFGDVLAVIESPLRRGRAMAGTNPASLHRLVQLIWRVEENILSIQAGSDEVDVLAALELQNMTAMFARWRHDPLFPHLLAESVHPPTFLHNYGLVCAASAFVDTKPPLGAELIRASHESSPDLRVRVSATRSFAVEVKTPAALQRRTGIDIGQSATSDVLRKAIRRSRPQLSSEECGVLVLVGNGWTGDIADYDRVACAELRRRVRPQLAGVLLVSTTIDWSRTRGDGSFQDDFGELDWTTTSYRRWIPNQRCMSNLRLEFDPAFSRYHLSWKPAT